MQGASISWHLVEACIYKYLRAIRTAIFYVREDPTRAPSTFNTLTEPALKWLRSLKPGSIGNFSTLVKKYYSKFEGDRSIEKQTSDLYGVIQKPGELVPDYCNSFNKEIFGIY